MSQLIYDFFKWACTASVMRVAVQMLVTTLRLSDRPPPRYAPEATPAISDEKGRTNTRTVRFLIPPNEAAEQALLSSASTKEKTNHHEVEVEVKENEKGDPPGDESDDDMRPVISTMVPFRKRLACWKTFRRQGLARYRIRTSELMAGGSHNSLARNGST